MELSENLVRLRTSEEGWRICPASLTARVPGKLTLDRLIMKFRVAFRDPVRLLDPVDPHYDSSVRRLPLLTARAAAPATVPLTPAGLAPTSG